MQDSHVPLRVWGYIDAIIIYLHASWPHANDQFMACGGATANWISNLQASAVWPGGLGARGRALSINKGAKNPFRQKATRHRMSNRRGPRQQTT